MTLFALGGKAGGFGFRSYCLSLAEGDSAAVSGYLSFRHDDLTVEVGQPA